MNLPAAPKTPSKCKPWQVPRPNLPFQMPFVLRSHRPSSIKARELSNMSGHLGMEPRLRSSSPANHTATRAKVPSLKPWNWWPLQAQGVMTPRKQWSTSTLRQMSHSPWTKQKPVHLSVSSHRSLLALKTTCGRSMMGHHPLWFRTPSMSMRTPQKLRSHIPSSFKRKTPLDAWGRLHKTSW